MLHHMVFLFGISWSAQAVPAASSPAVATAAAADTIPKARRKLEGAPTCPELNRLRDELARAKPAAGDPVAAATLDVLRAEVRVRLRACPKRKPPAPAADTPPGPDKPGHAKEPSAKAKPVWSDDAMALIEAQEKVLGGSVTCATSACQAGFDALSEDLLRLMLTVYAQAKPGDPVLPKLREKLGGLLIKNVAGRALLDRLKQMLSAGGVTAAELSQILEGQAAVELISLIHRRHGSRALAELLKDPASADAIATLLRQGGLGVEKLQVIVDAGVDRLLAGATTAAQKANLQRGLELAAALADPQAERNLVAAARVLRTRSRELDQLIGGIQNKRLDAATARALSHRIDRAIWDELVQNKEAIQRWEMDDPRVRERRILPIIVEPAAERARAPQAGGTSPLRRFTESYFRFLYSTGKLTPRPPLPVDDLLPVRELLDHARRMISQPNSGSAPSSDELDRALRLEPIGVVVVAGGAVDTDGRGRATVAWVIQAGSVENEWNRHEGVQSNPLPSSADSEANQDEIDAEAVRCAVATSHAMALLSPRMTQAFQASEVTLPRPANPYGALLFAGLPYLRDPSTPAWSRWVTSGADVAGTATTVGALLWSAKLRNDFSEGRSTSLSGANTALRVGVGTAIGVVGLRLLSAAYYRYRFARGR